MKLSLIVPCYNEEEGMENLHDKLTPILKELSEKWELELLFIDDGSLDKTLEKIKQFFGNLEYAKIIKHETNQNLGAGIRTGFKHSTGDVIVTMDSDCTYDPNGIFDMLNLLDDETSIVTASPYHPQGGVKNVPQYRLFLSKSITNIYRVVTGQKIHTFTALFRAHKKEVINIPFKSNDFLATAEHLISSVTRGHKIKEYPTILNVREYGVSKMRLFRVIKSHTKFVGKLVGKKLRGKSEL
jgi:dolichol-phosphate mannosyltransferase